MKNHFDNNMKNHFIVQWYVAQWPFAIQLLWHRLQLGTNC